MIDAAERAMELVTGTDPDGLAADRLRREALLWNSTVLGEASDAVSEATRAAHPGVPWRSPVQLRNRIVHGYWSVDSSILHTTATDQRPELVTARRAVLDGLDPTGGP
jgi:uncharacterized protein with HEPN domain